MKNTNVCKFPLSNSSNDLSIYCFVAESNLEVMLKKIKLAHNRMILVTQGCGDFLFNADTFPFSVGTLIFGFEGEHFSLKQGSDVNYIYIDFNGARAKSLLSRFNIYEKTRTNDNFNSLIPFFQNSLLRTPPSNVDIAAESVLLNVFSQLSTSVCLQNDIIRNVMEITEDNFDNPELSISFISKQLSYNSKYISHIFKKKTNTNYSEYLRSYRIKNAISLFELGISSVKNVAFLSGFSDPLYFSNAFKKSVGMSPKKFIAKLNENKKSN